MIRSSLSFSLLSARRLLTTVSSSSFRDEFDVVVVGSGAGGMTSALIAKSKGLSVVCLEKDKVFGGTSAVSGGGIWIPARGGKDADVALTYLRQVTQRRVEETKLVRFIESSSVMIDTLEQKFGIEFLQLNKYPDYFPMLEGAVEGGRSLEPKPFDGSKLGAEFDKLRECYDTMQMFGMSMTQTDAPILLGKVKGWEKVVQRIIFNYVFDLGWRMKTTKDRRLTMGQALSASLRHAMMEKNIELRLGSGLQSLVVDEKDNNRVSGVVVKTNDNNNETYAIRARKGVILATGGFEANAEMRKQYLSKSAHSTFASATPGCNAGDGIQAGLKLGAKVEFMDMVWGVPTIALPGRPRGVGIFMERHLPGCVMVNSNGERFVNEAAPYTAIWDAMIGEEKKEQQSGSLLPTWLIFDGTFRKKYPVGPILPSSVIPDYFLYKQLGKECSDPEKVLYRASSLEELAKKIQVNSSNLINTVSRLNEYSRTGVDKEFGKGSNVFDVYYGDPNVKPNPCLAPLDSAPFYALRLEAGDIGTKGGLSTNEDAQVLRQDGKGVIENLYAIGNTSAAVMGPSYAGAGSTLAPAMTFGFLAASHIAEKK